MTAPRRRGCATSIDGGSCLDVALQAMAAHRRGNRSRLGPGRSGPSSAHTTADTAVAGLYHSAVKIGREQLYKEVWAEPMTTVAKRYEVSSNYLARICERLNVPRPGRGYWQQRAVGAEVEPDPLPAVEPGDEIEWARDGSQPATAPMSSKLPRRWTNDADRPSKHPLLEGARGHFDEVRQGNPKTYVVPRKRNLVDIFVTPGTLDRALKVASELFLYLEDRGQRVVLAPAGRRYHREPADVREGAKPNQHDYDWNRGRWEPAVPTVVLVGEIVIGVRIFETMIELDAVYRDGKYLPYELPKEPVPSKRRRFAVPGPQPWISKHWFPTGRLALQAYAAERVAWEQTWREKTAGDLATMFETIAETFEGAVPTITQLLEEQRREAERRAKEYEEQRKRWQREENERRRKEEEGARAKRIQQDVEAWRLARDIRAFVAEAKQMVADADCRITKGGPLEESLEVALAYAESVDPLAQLRTNLRRTVAEREASGGADARPDPTSPK